MRTMFYFLKIQFLKFANILMISNTHRDSYNLWIHVWNLKCFRNCAVYNSKPSKPVQKNYDKKENILEKNSKEKWLSFKIAQIFISDQSTFEITYITCPQSFENFSRFNSLRLVILTLFFESECIFFIPAENFDEFH